MKLSRRTAAFLAGTGVWNVITWAIFARNLAADTGRPTGFYVAHTGLIVVNLGIGVVLGVLGWRAWRARRTVASQYGTNV